MRQRRVKLLSPLKTPEGRDVIELLFKPQIKDGSGKDLWKEWIVKMEKSTESIENPRREGCDGIRVKLNEADK